MRILGLHRGRDASAVLLDNGKLIAAAQEERFSRIKQDQGDPIRAARFCQSFGAPDLIATPRPEGFGGNHLAFDPARCTAASAYFASPFADAMVLGLEDDAFRIWQGRGRHLSLSAERPSITPLYRAVTRQLGFLPHTGEFKVMGLAPYGQPRFLAVLERGELPNFPDRAPAEEILQIHYDLAASIQKLAEMRILSLLDLALPGQNVALGGFMALNCVANGMMARHVNLWVQPAAGPAGLALGAALCAWHDHLGHERDDDCQTGLMGNAALGPEYDLDQIQADLSAAGARFIQLSQAALLDKAAQCLAQGGAIGWFQGRAEFGPRALGFRSILADPTRAEAQGRLNEKIKFREPFRPFAPAVLAQDHDLWFEAPAQNPHMLLVGRSKTDRLKSVTHVDGSARIQSVTPDFGAFYHLLHRFKALTGVGCLINTSFNVRGQPMVNSPKDAFACLMGSGLDGLAIGPFWLDKADQDPKLAQALPIVPD